MRKINICMALFATLTLISVAANAREEAKTGLKQNSHSAFKTEASDCVSPRAQFDLDINNVRARLLTGGDMWWNLSEARYEVPKSDGTGTSLNALFAGAIWITGKDAGNNLKCAAQRYRAGGDDFWTGPITNGSVEKATCSQYDRFFSVLGADIAKAQAAFALKGSQIGIADIPKGLLTWPGKGNPYLASDPTLLGETYNVIENLAPFKDIDGDGVYDPLRGDFPIIPCRGKESDAYADQMVFWVMNDVGNLHTETSGQAIGVQINAMAFAFQTTDDINNMTFYKYEIINKSSNELRETYISQWADPDLGCYENDRVGCDVSRSLGVVYNDGDDNDCNGVGGYGDQLPLLGIDFFEGPLGDDALHTQLGLTSFVYFTNGATASQADPSSARQYRNYMEGFWADGTPFTEGGTAYNSGGPVTKFCFPGEPCDGAAWSDQTSGQPAADRRFVQTSGPFTLTTGTPQYVTIGCVFVRPPGGVGSPPCFANTIGPADDKAQLLFNQCFKLPDGPQAPNLNIRELSNQIIINLENLAGTNNYGESFDELDANAIQYSKLHGGVTDSTYTFEGYKVYQVANNRVSATDLDDPEKAILYAQVDVKNGVSRIINFEKDPVLGLQIPVMKVDGADAGIVSSFNVTQDLFASGDDKRLVNHKTYYYTAVAYAYNNYKQYEQDNPDGNAQLFPYLQGRLNFKIYSAIPHIPDPRNEGTVLNSKWGDGVEVKRIEGQGNGANNLQLDAATIEKIVTSGAYAFGDTLNYLKGYDPIGFKVSDPVSLKEADFDLQFAEDTFYTIEAEVGVGNTYDTLFFSNVKSEWISNFDTIEKILEIPSNLNITQIFSYTLQDYRWKWYLHDLTNNETIASERYNDRPYEQFIAINKNGERIDYGFSIKLGTPAAVYTIDSAYLSNSDPKKFVYDALPSTIEYQNPVEQWLGFLADQGSSEPSNWIRSGETFVARVGSTTPPLANVYDDSYWYPGTGTGFNASSPPTTRDFSDPQERFEKMANGTWAPYCLTANYANKAAPAGAPPFVYGPGFKWRNYGSAPVPPPQNNLDKLASVDIIITPDKSKWTRCVVFETGEDEVYNEGNSLYPRPLSPAILQNKGALKGQIRMHYSWDKDHQFYEDGTHPENNFAKDTGRSWFPGYAINIETGERLNIAFGESSDQIEQRGNDMIWNPTDKLYAPVANLPYFGGKHFIYVMSTKYDEGKAAQDTLLANYTAITGNNLTISAATRNVYLDLMWTSIPYLARGYSFVDGYIPPAEVKVKLRVEKPFNRLATIATAGDPLPHYQFSTKGLGTTEKNHDVAVSACDMIRAVPNPYLAYSAYETDQNSNRVKITNLPNKCSITIYALDGTVIRKLSRSIDVDPATQRKIDISEGNPVTEVNLDNTIDWDLKNDKGVPIAGGVYLIHIEAPGICEKTIKWFGVVRPADTSNF